MAAAIVVAAQKNLDFHAPPSFDDLAADLNNDLLAINGMDDKYYGFKHRDIYFQIAQIAIGIWTYIKIRSIAWKLLPLFEMSPAPKPWHIYSGEKKLRKDMFGAMFASGLVIGYLLIYTSAEIYLIIDGVMDRFRLQ